MEDYDPFLFTVRSHPLETYFYPFNFIVHRPNCKVKLLTKNLHHTPQLHTQTQRTRRYCVRFSLPPSGSANFTPVCSRQRCTGALPILFQLLFYTVPKYRSPKSPQPGTRYLRSFICASTSAATRTILGWAFVTALQMQHPMTEN